MIKWQRVCWGAKCWIAGGQCGPEQGLVSEMSAVALLDRGRLDLDGEGPILGLFCLWGCPV